MNMKGMKMEALEQLRRRELLRYSPEILEPVVVNTVDDIKRVLATFDPAKNPQSSSVPISTVMEGADGDRGKRQFAVSAETKSKSQRDILLEGLDLIKNRLEIKDNLNGEAVDVGGKLMKPAKVHAATDGYSWVDPMIKHWFGGYREGIHICWDIGGYQYRYEPYQHKLTRVKIDATGPPATGTIQKPE
jgi:hypothetical protein